MKTVSTDQNGIVRIDNKIVGVMFDPSKTNLFRVLFKYYTNRVKEFLKQCGKAAAYAINR